MPIMAGRGVWGALVSIEWQRFPRCEEEGRPCALLMLTTSHETSLVSSTEEKHVWGGTEAFSCLPGNMWGLWKLYEVCANLYFSVSGWTTNCKGSQAVLCMFVSVQGQNSICLLYYRQTIKSYFSSAFSILLFYLQEITRLYICIRLHLGYNPYMYL